MTLVDVFVEAAELSKGTARTRAHTGTEMTGDEKIMFKVRYIKIYILFLFRWGFRTLSDCVFQSK